MTRQACCGNCSAWERTKPMSAQGMCRRNPPHPVLVGITESGIPVVRYYWVETLDTFWCRDGYEPADVQVKPGAPEVDISKLELGGSA